MRLVLSLSLLLATVPLFAATSVVIENLYPNEGSVAGGDQMFIEARYTRDGLFCDPIDCASLVTVTFGGVQARSAVHRGRGLYEVVTPAHARGRVPITITLPGATASGWNYTFIDRETSHLPIQNYDIVLVPAAITAPGGAPGAFGSLWKSELWVTNRGAYPVELFFEDPRCAPNAGCAESGYPALAPGEVRQLVLPANSGGDGRLIWLQKGGAADVAFSLRIRDVSRSEDNHGTELQLPHEADRRDKVTLLNVPIDNRSRAGLRIFGEYAGFNAKVTFTPIDGGTTAATKSVLVNAPQPNDGFHASMAFIGDVRAVFPELADGTYRVDIEGAPLWALVSVTNNRTQLVTAIEPQ
ncbi:MAG TPA: hypothetical protein VKB93_08040 [Thermoanaerobaculia bacterium]|nr:hypothetical protein [Thermoanaerobaculia bacterium]